MPSGCLRHSRLHAYTDTCPTCTQADVKLELTRANSTNVLDGGLRIGGIGRRMNSKVNQSNKVYIESKLGGELGLLSIWPSPSSPGPYI
jgi:hypothetical protein